MQGVIYQAVMISNGTNGTNGTIFLITPIEKQIHFLINENLN